MNSTNASKSTPAWRAAAAIANLLAFALLVAVVAHWGWRWFGPRPLALPPAPPADVAQTLAVSPPFGAGGAVLAQEPLAAPLAGAGNTRLVGVFAEPGGKGHALIRMPDGTVRTFAAGASLSPDATLVAVAPDGVTIRDGGGERRLALRSPSDTSPPPKARGAAATSAACALPAGFKGSVVRLNAELLQGLIAQPESLRAIAEARDGGLLIRDTAGFAALLGMQKGDRVSQANGIALRAPDDVIVAVLRPLAASQPVRLVGTRGGEARELYILNAGACPG